jgi:hypothetical protein
MEIQLNPRKETKTYNLKLNQSTLEILGLVFEFKIAASWHIARFLSQRDQSKYIYLKLRRMWQAGYLDSFKLFSGSLAGIPIYYTLSRSGLKVLAQNNLYSPSQLSKYPSPKILFSSGLFEHEKQIVELASLEAKNQTKDLKISFKGEIASQGTDFMDDKTIEALTPDYTVFYTHANQTEIVYSEMERTQKGKLAMLRKVERYKNFLKPEQIKNRTLRIIFQTPEMEQSFWLNIYTNRPQLLNTLRIITTNTLLLKDQHQFVGEIYASQKSIKLSKPVKLIVDTSRRVRLFDFLGN